MAGLKRSVTAVSVLPLGDADHRREVGHRMPTANGDVFRWQFVKLDETAVSWNFKRFEVVNNRCIEAALRFDRSTRVTDNCDVGVALRVARQPTPWFALSDDRLGMVTRATQRIRLTGRPAPIRCKLKPRAGPSG